MYGMKKRLSGAQTTGKSVYCERKFHSVIFHLQPDCSCKRKGDSFRGLDPLDELRLRGIIP